MAQAEILGAAPASALLFVVMVRTVCVALPQGAWAAALFVLLAPLPLRYGAEAYSEPLFHLVLGR